MVLKVFVLLMGSLKASRRVLWKVLQGFFARLTGQRLLLMLPPLLLPHPWF